jgi:ribosomal protein S18 acetylase RimI-like enzyme
MSILLSYRKANRDDLAFLLALRKSTMAKYLEAAGLYLSDQEHCVRLQEHFNDSQLILINNKPIGLLKLAVMKEHIHIRQFQILPKYQGKGVGTQVLKSVIAKAAKLNLYITLNVLLANPAKTLYQRMGFYITGQNELEYHMRYDHC